MAMSLDNMPSTLPNIALLARSLSKPTPASFRN
jgi:hypothetical protein